MKTNWIVIGAVAAMISTTASGAGAQSNKTLTPTTIAANTMTNYTLEMSDMWHSDTPDYTLLSNPMYNYSQLKAAKDTGLSDNQVASVMCISMLSGVPFSETMQKVQAGKTFPEIAYEDNLKLSDVYNVDNAKQQIAAYIAAYETTGAFTLDHSKASNMMNMNMDMNSGS